jgi:ACS family 4-hydroxyphenylacetate permease-like MFS transporter
MSAVDTSLDITPVEWQKRQAVTSKVARRLLGLLFILFCASYLDRINISFAALSMNNDLGLSATAFGLANTAFYVGYVIFEIPSNFMLEKFGARRWIARIMVTWGIASTCTLFAVGPHSLSFIRFIVGITEAGFLPGVLLYMTYWFPAEYRARANSRLMIAMPVTTAIGAITSGLILKLDGTWGLAGWQWLFLLEGTPTILLGIVAWFFLTDRPATAKWLTADEKATLATMLDEDKKPAATGGWKTAREGMPWQRVIALSFSYFCLVLTLNALATWTPQIVKVLRRGDTLFHISLWSAIPSACAIAVMLMWSRRSDRVGERKVHTAIPMLVAAIGCLMTGYAGDLQLRMLGVILATCGGQAAITIFWTSPAGVLDPRNRALGIGIISSSGLAGSAISPLVFGVLRDLTHSFASGLAFTATMLVVGSIVILSTSIPRTRPALEESSPLSATSN